MLQSFNGILSNLEKLHNYYVTNKAEQTKVINYLQQAIIDFKEQRQLEFNDYADLLLFNDLASKVLANIATTEDVENLHIIILKIRMQLVGLREQKSFLVKYYKKITRWQLRRNWSKRKLSISNLKQSLRLLSFMV